MNTDKEGGAVGWEDPIVAEVRKVRENLLAEAGYDLDELSRRLREKQTASGRTVVVRSPRRPQGVEAEVST